MATKKEKQKSLEELIPDAEMREKVMSGLYSGKKLFGSEGVFTDLLQAMINAGLQGEMTAHLSEEKKKGEKNRRNGIKRKRVKTEGGMIEVLTPRDRAGSYEPLLVEPWKREINTGLNDMIISLYARGQTVSDIRYQLEEIYGVQMSAGAISTITEQVWSTIVEWQQRDLESCYAIIYLDGIRFKVREGGKYIEKVSYSVYGVDVEGNRDLLGLYLRPSEGANNWGQILEDLQKRGLEDVFFFCIDGLAGFANAIREVYPSSLVQRCIVHKVRNSVRFVNDKDKKKVCADLKKIYSAAGIEEAEMALVAFKEKWDKKYPSISPKWEADWADLMVFMDFGKEIRRMIYTTNPVEALHRVIRKVTKSKRAWTNDKALFKQIYLTLMHNKKSWKRKAFAWKSIQIELAEKFGERYLKHLK